MASLRLAILRSVRGPAAPLTPGVPPAGRRRLEQSGCSRNDGGMMDELQRVATGIVIETKEDAMSQARRITITFPLHGPQPTPEDLLEVLAALTSEGPASLAEVREQLAGVSFGEAPPEPLSAEYFHRRAAQLLATIDDVLQELPADHRSAMRRALDQAYRLGQVCTELKMRERHLDDVTREVEKMKPAQRRGGEARRGKFKEDTERLCAFMQDKVEEGHPIRNAARLAFKKRLGTSEDGNRKRYDNWLRRRNGSNQSNPPNA